MTPAAFWVISAVALLLLLALIYMTLAYFGTKKRLGEQTERVCDWMMDCYAARDEAELWKKRYWDLENRLVKEAHDIDMNYIRDSLRRAADGDPTT